MSVAHRTTGTWAELTADGSVTIPATPQSGDRMYLFARWKDFSITATVANWTELTEFADGAVSSGNGTGSVKVACWYRDWQAGDSDPTIDFSASPTNASAVITVMSKGADDVWLTPVAVMAAMTNWTTSSQSVAASATATVLSGGVVMGLISIRDDTAVMTRPTNGIDDSGALVTWNGNYVESPATHHSTTTGDDGAADLGYRLVTTGAAGVTLRMTGTIGAAETGAALWVVQGVSVQVTPTAAILTNSRFTPQLKLAVAPVPASLTLTRFVPQLREVVSPAVTAFSLSNFSPALQLQVGPAPAMFSVTSFSPQLRETLTPAIVVLNLVTFSPSLSEIVAPATAIFTLTTTTPTLVENIITTPPSASFTITFNRPFIKPFRLLHLDPGGDTVQDKGYFHTLVSDGGNVSFDNTHQVVGIGSYKFDSGASLTPTVAIENILGPARRHSFYWQYDSLPDAEAATSSFPTDFGSTYSGGGFTDSPDMASDDGLYATATPTRNAGQGTIFDTFPDLDIPPDSFIVSVKFIYEWKVDTADSEAISRVKWRVNGEEGPNHDNAAEPLTDTVVEVDVTSDRTWEPQDFADGVFELIIEACRGDTDTAHTQSVDYVKVEVVYHPPAKILALLTSSNQTLVYLSVVPVDGNLRVRFIDGAGSGYMGITELLPNVFNRITFAYVLHGQNNLDVAVFVNGVPELAIEAAHTADFSDLSNGNLHYGWLTTPGEDHLCWFEQLVIDDGDDLQDTGNVLSTAKLPASTNENNFNTTGGTGAVNERPLSITNFKQHTAVTAVRQSYTLQDAATGDIDLTGETLVGHMVWVWTKLGAGDVENVFLIANGEDIDISPRISTTPALMKYMVTSTSYPSNAAGVGLVSNAESADTFLYEGGIVQAYLGPSEDDSLFPFQPLAENSLTPVIDDLRVDLPDSYELRYRIDEGAQVAILVYTIASEGAALQLYDTAGSSGGSGQMIINAPGIEVQIFIVVIGGSTSVELRRFLNPD